ncbi:MAG: isopeptide-forming domain-containing fimbrial protein [Novosphingobium sp.]|uniref:isopeptide-forming domain-containing fimbrial protein n=1 Tax=Novosphingobium sp. TaxID=1874826 RepID=UPI003B9C869A
MTFSKVLLIKLWFSALLTAMLLSIPCATSAQEMITNTATANWTDHGQTVSATSNTVSFPVETAVATMQTLRYLPDGSGTIALALPSCGQRSMALSGSRTSITLNGSLLPSDSFRIGELLYVRISAPSANRSANAIDQLQIKATTSSGDEELMTIAETGVNTGEFLAAIATTAIPPAPTQRNCQLSVHSGDSITVEIADSRFQLAATPVSSVQVLADPYGLVFDSSDGAPIDGVTITLIDDATGQPAQVFADDGITGWPSTVVTGQSVTDASGTVYPMPAGEYRFPLAALGSYRLRVVPPTGFVVPSTVPVANLGTLRRPEGNLVELSDASFGGVVTLTSPNPVRVDIPVDSPSVPLGVTKAASREVINPGDPVIFTVLANNPNTKRALFNVTVKDTPSRWLRFVPKSVRIDGQSADAAVSFTDDGRQMTITLGRIAAGQTVKITYAMTARPDAPAGEASNLVQLADERGQTTTAQARVKIEDEVLASRMTLIGRVSAGDCNVREGRSGIPGVRVMLEDGSFAITDADGRYHFEGLVPGTHVVQVAEQTLPEGGRFIDCAASTRSAGNATSRFVTGQGGTLAVADFSAVLREQTDAAPAAKSAEAEKAATVQEAELEDRKSAGAEIDWLAMGDGPADFLFPAADHNPRSPAIRVAIRHRKGETVELRANGKPVDSVAFDGASVSPQGFAVSVWRGVPLEGGLTVLSATVRATDGGEVATLKRDVHFVQVPARVTLVPEKSRLIADGSTRPVLALRVTDRNGRPVHAGITGEFTLNQPYESALAIDAMQSRTLSGLDRAAPTFVIKGDDGIAYVELAPTMVSGPLRAEFLFKDETITRRQTLESWIAPGDQKWTLVGLAEAAGGKSSVARQMQRDGQFDSDLGDNARVAFYAKGRVLGKFLLTASYDSAKQKDQQRLLGAIDPNAYYTVFADGSSRRFDSASRDKLYVRLEARAFYAIYGDFVTAFDQTVLARYQRTVTGAAAEGAFGAVHVQGFAARTGDTHRRDEIQGGGISGPYRLSSRRIIANSEIVTLQVRDRFRSEVIVETKTLERFIDYDIDLLSGTITFRAPVLSRDENLNPRFIVVDYEIEQAAGGEINAGLRADVTTLGGTLRIGATAITDTGANNGARSDLAAVDVKAALGTGTELRAELGLSRLGGDYDNAWIAEIEHHDGALDALAYVRSAGRGFGLGQLNNAERGRRKIGMDGRYRLNEAFAVTASAWFDDSLTDAAQRKAAEVNGVWRSRDTEARIGMAMFDDRLADGSTARTTTIEAGATKHFFDNRLEINGAASVALGAAESIDLPSRYRVGAAYAFTPSIKLIGTYERASGKAVSADTVQAGFEVGPWDGARVVSSLGQQSLSEYGKRSFAAFGLTQSLPVTPSLTIDATVDHSTTLAGIETSKLINVDQPASSGGNLGDAGTIAEDFTAVTFGATWRRDRWSVTGRGEMRNGQLTDRKGVVLGAIRQLGEGSMAGAGFTMTRAVDESGQRSRIFDAALSLAHRPTDSTLALLSKLELRSDEIEAGNAAGSRTALLTGTDAKSTRMMASTSLNWSPRSDNAQRSELGLFGAVRHTFDAFEGYDLAGTSLIGGLDARLGIGESIEIGAVATVRHDLSSDTTSFAFGPQIGISLVKDTMITIGYNISGYRDPDFIAARQTAEGIFVVFRMKFDSDSLAFLGLRQ